jgi:hypothetical protein
VTQFKNFFGAVFEFCIFVLQPGLSFVVDQLACSSMATACITTMHDQICQVSCKHHSSLGTWLASAMVSFSCLGLSDSVLLYSLYVTYTALSSASSKSLGVLKVQQVVWFFLYWAHL